MNPASRGISKGWLRARREAGTEGAELLVSCPHLGAEVGLTKCQNCRSAISLAVDEAGMAVFVRCGAQVPGDPGISAEPPTESAGDSVVGIMRDTVCVADSDLPVDELAEALIEEGIGGAPVVDDNGRLIGIASKTDLLRRWREHTLAELSGPYRVTTQSGEITLDGQGPPARTASDVMSEVLHTVGPNTSIVEAAALMAYEGVHRLPVIDERGQLVGLVSALDVVRWVAQRAGYHAPAFGDSRQV